MCTLCVGRTCSSFSVVQCVEQIRSRTLFLKDKELFPQGRPPGWGTRGFISTDVTLCLSHTKGKRCWQLGWISAIKHSFRRDKRRQKRNRPLTRSVGVDKICPFTWKESFRTDRGAPVQENGLIKVHRGEPRTQNGFQLLLPRIFQRIANIYVWCATWNALCAWFWGLTTLAISEKGFPSQPTSIAWKTAISAGNGQNHTSSMKQDWPEDWLWLMLDCTVKLEQHTSPSAAPSTRVLH